MININPPLGTFVSIAALFFLFLAIHNLLKNRLKRKFCVLCAAVSITWLIFLVLHKIGLFDDAIIISLLIGQSSLGVFYLWEKKIKEKTKLFRLPFLLTLTAAAYLILQPERIADLLAFLFILWLIFSLLYLLKNNPGIKIFLRKIAECCKRW